jgi:hypothetical protein
MEIVSRCVPRGEIPPFEAGLQNGEMFHGEHSVRAGLYVQNAEATCFVAISRRFPFRESGNQARPLRGPRSSCSWADFDCGIAQDRKLGTGERLQMRQDFLRRLVRRLTGRKVPDSNSCADVPSFEQYSETCRHSQLSPVDQQLRCSPMIFGGRAR